MLYNRFSSLLSGYRLGTAGVVGVVKVVGLFPGFMALVMRRGPLVGVGSLAVADVVGMCAFSRLGGASRILVADTVRTAAHDCTPCSGFSMKTTTLLTGKVIMAKAGRRGTTCPSNLYTRHAALFCTGSRCPSRPILALTVTTHARGSFVSLPVPPYNTYHRMVLRARGHCGRPVHVLLCKGGRVCRIGDVNSLLPLSFSTSTVGRW